jgi:hypothetical protein
MIPEVVGVFEQSLFARRVPNLAGECWGWMVGKWVAQKQEQQEAREMEAT